jgi:hypothetical protein
MNDMISALKQDAEELQERIESKIVEGRNLLEGYKRATMMTYPNIRDVEEVYQYTIKEIYILRKAKKFILKSAKFLEKLEK